MTIIIILIIIIIIIIHGFESEFEAGTGMSLAWLSGDKINDNV